MNVMQRAAVQRCMGRMGDIDTVVAAMFSTNSPDAIEEFHFEAPGDNGAVLAVITGVACRFRTAGRAELLNQPVEVAGESLSLLASVYQGMGYTPYMVAVTRPPADAFALHRIRCLMDQVARCCIDTCNSPRWS